jgi:predicted DNA binding CopG/RHH family protein
MGQRMTAPKEIRLHIRATEAQLEQFKAAAEARGLTLSAWARMVLTEASAPQVGQIKTARRGKE